MKREYYIIGDVAALQHEEFPIDSSQQELNLGLCIYFLVATFGEPPLGSSLEIITATYAGVDFRTIAVGFDSASEPAGTYEYALKLEIAQFEFARAVQWPKIQRARVNSIIAESLANIERLRSIREDK